MWVMDLFQDPNPIPSKGLETKNTPELSEDWTEKTSKALSPLLELPAIIQEMQEQRTIEFQ